MTLPLPKKLRTTRAKANRGISFSSFYHRAYLVGCLAITGLLGLTSIANGQSQSGVHQFPEQQRGQAHRTQTRATYAPPVHIAPPKRQTPTSGSESFQPASDLQHRIGKLLDRMPRPKSIRQKSATNRLRTSKRDLPVSILNRSHSNSQPTRQMDRRQVTPANYQQGDEFALPEFAPNDRTEAVGLPTESAIDIVAPMETFEIDDESDVPLRHLPERYARLDETGRPISVLDSEAASSHSGNQLRRTFGRNQARPVGNLREYAVKQGDERGFQSNSSFQDDDSMRVRPATLSCDDYRKRLLDNPIQKVALDISPHKSAESKTMESRTWTDRYGQELGYGRMVDLRRGYVILEGPDGPFKISHARLSEQDLVVVADFWEIPTSCTVGGSDFEDRNWVPQIYTWNASGLCHKPLYFENVQLERYGHTSGPFSQPFHSTIHFFGSLFTLPYQTAIHPPNECRYALGYYRPGNCAPWLRDPIPISLRGISRQTGVTLGLSYLP